MKESTGRARGPTAGRVLLVASINVVAVATVALLVEAARRAGVGFTTFTDDRSSGETRWFAGLLSDVGVGLWFVSAVGAAIAALVHRDDARPFVFFGAMAAASTWLAFDDLLLLHEDVLPRRLGVAESSSLAAYLVVVVLLVVVCFDVVRRHDPWILGLAGALLVGSLTATRIGIGPFATSSAEAASKFIGIVNWTTFFAFAAVCRRCSVRESVGVGRRQIEEG